MRGWPTQFGRERDPVGMLGVVRAGSPPCQPSGRVGVRFGYSDLVRMQSWRTRRRRSEMNSACLLITNRVELQPRACPVGRSILCRRRGRCHPLLIRQSILSSSTCALEKCSDDQIHDFDFITKLHLNFGNLHHACLLKGEKIGNLTSDQMQACCILHRSLRILDCLFMVQYHLWVDLVQTYKSNTWFPNKQSTAKVSHLALELQFSMEEVNLPCW